MHGLIFLELKYYIQTKFNSETWEKLINEAGLQDKYTAIKAYPDSDIIHILTEFSKFRNEPLNPILKDFGVFIAPKLLRSSRHLINDKWTVLDLFENTQQIIHCVIVKSLEGSSPPILKTTRPSPHELHILYTSPRKMCAFAKGLIEGMAEVYTTPVAILEKTCMHHGDAQCELVVRRHL